MDNLKRTLSRPDESHTYQWHAFWSDATFNTGWKKSQEEPRPQELPDVKTEKTDETALIDVDTVLQDLYVQTELSLKGSKYAATKLTKQERINPFKTLLKFKFDLKAASEEIKGLKAGVKDRSVALQEANANLDKTNKKLNRELQVRFF